MFLTMEVIYEDPELNDAFSWKNFPKATFYRKMLTILFIKCCAEEVIRNGKLFRKRRCMACDYDHPSERRPHIGEFWECDISSILCMYYHDLLVKTYEDAEETIFKDFVKICDERNILQSVMLDCVDWLNYNYKFNVDGMNGAINDYVCLLLSLH